MDNLNVQTLTRKNGKTIEYRVVITPKNHYCTSYDNNVVVITAPENYKKREVEAHLSKMFLEHYLMTHDEEHRKYKGKKTVHLLGKIYYAKIKQADKDEVSVNEETNTITLYCKKNTLSQHKAIYRRFLKQVLEKELSGILYEASFDFKEIAIPKIEIKPMANYLGLNKGGKLIYLHPQIARQAPIYVKTLVYHEICHCIIANHEKEFYDLLDTKIKEGSKLNKELVERHYYDVF